MSGVTQLVLLLGEKIITWLIIFISCVLVAGGLLWQQQKISKQYHQQQSLYQQQIPALLQGLSQGKINHLHQLMDAATTSEQIKMLFLNGDDSKIAHYQQQLVSQFPNANKACLIGPELDNIGLTNCMAIGFATLNSLRQAKNEGKAAIALIQASESESHILLAQSVLSDEKQFIGVLLLQLKPTVLSALLHRDASFKGYIELQQGDNKTVLAASGDPQQKIGAGRSMLLTGSHWSLAYWPQKVFVINSSVNNIIIIISLLILLWLIQQRLRYYLFNRDIKTLRQQLADLNSGSLKPEYSMSAIQLTPLVDDILLLGQESYKKALKRGATAQSVSKKMDQLEQSAPLQVELIEEGLFVDPVIFRAYDIRGIVDENLDEQSVKAIGQAVGSEAMEQGQMCLVVARDGRLSSRRLSAALIDGILASGCDVTDVGEVPTPVMYFACEQLKLHSGIMVTGSHNPAQYNGLKISLAGQAVVEQGIQKIRQRIEQGDLRQGQGQCSHADIRAEYINRISGDIRIDRPMKIVIDCGNGVAASIAPQLFKALGCEVIELFCEIDGSFPNHHPNPSDPENLVDLAHAVQQHQAELGLAFDGDGDRLGVVDANGSVIWPDRLMMLFSQDLLTRKPGATVLYDVKSTNLLGQYIEDLGGQAIMSKSGYALIKNKMTAVDAQLAGELSGHIFFKERWYGFDDALYAASRLLEILSTDPRQRSATDVFTALPSRYSTHDILVEMAEGESQHFMQKFISDSHFDNAQLIIIDGLRVEYSYGWALIRASNTSPGVTLRFEADSLEELDAIQQEFKQQILKIKPSLALNF